MQDFGHIALHHAPSQTLGNRRLANTSLTHQQRIIFTAAAQRLNHPLHLSLTSDQRIDLAFGGQLIEILCELIERAFFLRSLCLNLIRVFRRLLRLRLLIFTDAVGDVVDHIQPRHALLVQVVDRVGIFLAENRDQHIGTGHLFLAIRCRLYMHDGALNDPLEAQRRLGINLT